MLGNLLALNLLAGDFLVVAFVTWLATVTFADPYFTARTDWTTLFSDLRQGKAENVFRRVETVYAGQLLFFVLAVLFGFVATAVEDEKALVRSSLLGLVAWLQLGFGFFVYDLNLTAPYRKTPADLLNTFGKPAPGVRPYREVALKWLPVYLLTGVWPPLLVIPNL